MTNKSFNSQIKKFYRKNGWKFPWRGEKDPYRILVSELMLQQTQTARVIPYYKKFLHELPTIQSLARAPLSKVLMLWRGLGYNRRALFLKRAAEKIVKDFHGKIPRDPELLVTLPGVGKNTAGAVVTFAFDKPAIFIETNIRKTFIHFFFKNKKSVLDKEILKKIEETVDRKNPREWYYAVVDFGAHLAKTKRGMNLRSAHYKRQSPFEGSNRQVRARLLRYILDLGPITTSKLERVSGFEKSQIKENLKSLSKEGFIEIKKGAYSAA